MKKTLLTLLCVLVTLCVSAAEGDVITSIDGIVNTKTYVLSTNGRGYLSSNGTQAERNLDTPHEWALLKGQKGYYLYDNASKKFFGGSNATLTAKPTSAYAIENSAYPDGDYKFTLDSDNGCFLQIGGHWNDEQCSLSLTSNWGHDELGHQADKGLRWKIAEAKYNLDFAAQLAQIAAFEKPKDNPCLMIEGVLGGGAKWDQQIWYNINPTLDEDYVLSFDVYSTSVSKISVKTDYTESYISKKGWQGVNKETGEGYSYDYEKYYPEVSTKSKWQHYTVNITSQYDEWDEEADAASGVMKIGHIRCIKFNFAGHAEGTVYLDNIKLVKANGGTESVIANSDFATEEVGRWSKDGYGGHAKLALSVVEAPEDIDWECPEGETDITSMQWVNNGLACAKMFGTTPNGTIVYGADKSYPEYDRLSYVDVTNYGCIKVYGGVEGGKVRIYVNYNEYGQTDGYGAGRYEVTFGADGVATLDFSTVLEKQTMAQHIRITGVKSLTDGNEIVGITLSGEAKTLALLPTEETDIFTLPWVNKGERCTRHLSNSTSTVYGTSAATPKSYVDISAYGYLKLYGTNVGDKACVYINRSEAGDDAMFNLTMGDDKTAVLSMADVVVKQPNAYYLHLNAVTSESGNVKLQALSLYGDPVTLKTWSCPEGETDVTTLEWVKNANDRAVDFGEDKGTVFGTDAGGNNLSYVDISNYGMIKVYGKVGDEVRAFINRSEYSDLALSQYHATIGEEGYAVINMNDVTTNQPKAKYLHLNGIKAGPTSADKATVYGITVCGDPVELYVDTYDRSLNAVDAMAIATRDGNTWTFNETFDASSYNYLVITTVMNASAAKGTGAITLKDNHGGSINGWSGGYEGGPRGNLFLDRWNNQNCLCITLSKMPEGKVDITQLKSISTDNNCDNISNIYFTNYLDSKAVQSGGTRIEGDYVRTYTTDQVGKFGTIVFDYTTAVSGAKIYEVASFDASTGLMLSEHTGLMVAGTPYFYMACDEEGNNGSKEQSNVNFWRVESATAEHGDYSCTKEEVGYGLVGCYAQVTPSTWWYDFIKGSSYILTGGVLRNINEGKATIPAHYCFFDKGKYEKHKPVGAIASVRIQVLDDEVTAIDSVVEKTLNSDRIYDLSGREVKEMKKGGTYIMGGMKVHIK